MLNVTKKKKIVFDTVLTIKTKLTKENTKKNYKTNRIEC